jgi:hypothetical protein
MTVAIVRDPIYGGRRFQSEIIELCVRWYLTYRLSYRELVEMLAERGVVSLIPWRSSRPNPFLDRQQSCIERVGVGTRHDPFQ